jgi:hypothetical protein
MSAPEPGQAFVIGAQRCGTTSLATALERHPQVAVAQPRRPEPKAFLVPGADRDVDGYLTRFYGALGPDVRVRCEKSTSYLGSELACAQIARAFPEAHVVAMLRDPVDRAVSHYRFSRASGVEDLPLEEALDPAAEGRPWDTDAISVSPFEYLRRSRYVDDLRRWFDAFPADRMHVLVLEDLVAEPSGFTGLLAALGLDPAAGEGFVPEERHNAGEGDVALDAGTRARLAAWFADANADLAQLLGRPMTRWS